MVGWCLTDHGDNGNGLLEFSFFITGGCFLVGGDIGVCDSSTMGKV